MNGNVSRGDQTRARILKVAERLFSEHGFDGVSMRALVARSSVNLSSVNYYFGSKEALFEEVFACRARVITEKRLKMLRECRSGNGGPPLLDQIIEAFLRPVMEGGGDGGGIAYARIRIRLAAERGAWARDLPSRLFDESSHQFIDMLAAALPELPVEELYWRFNLMVAAMYFTIANPARIEYLSRGLVTVSDEEQAIRYLVKFFCLGFRADPLLSVISRRRNSRSSRQDRTLVKQQRKIRTPGNMVK